MDLIERLRFIEDYGVQPAIYEGVIVYETAGEAADEIERLRAQIAARAE